MQNRLEAAEIFLNAKKFAWKFLSVIEKSEKRKYFTQSWRQGPCL